MSSGHDSLFSVSGAPILREHFSVSVTYDGVVVKAAVEAEGIVDEDDGHRNRRKYRRVVTVYRTATTPDHFYPQKPAVVDGVTYTVHKVVHASATAVVLDVRRGPATEVSGKEHRIRR